MGIPPPHDPLLPLRDPRGGAEPEQAGRAAGRITGRQLVNRAMIGSALAAVANLVLAGLPATNGLPWVPISFHG